MYQQKCGTKKVLSLLLALVMALSLVPAAAFAVPAGEAPLYSFGTAGTQLAPGTYNLPISMMNASKPTNPSMAADCVRGGQLEVQENGDAYVTVQLGVKILGKVEGWSSQWEIYNEYNAEETTATTLAEVVEKDAAGHDAAIRFKLPFTDQDGVYAKMSVEAVGMNPSALLKMDFAKAVKSDAPAAVKGTASATMLHESKDQPSMCDIMFDSVVNLTRQDGNVTLEMRVANPVPGFPDQGADGTVKNVKVTYGGQQYDVASDLTAKPKMIAKVSNPAFGFKAGCLYDAQVLTVTLPEAALTGADTAEGALLKTDAFVNVAMMTDVVFRIKLTDLKWDGHRAEPKPADKNGAADVSFGGSKAYGVTARVSVLNNVITDVALNHDAAANNHQDSVSFADNAKAMAQNFQGLAANDKAAIEGVDVVAQATITSNAYREAVLKALGLYEAPKPADLTFGSTNTRLEPGTYLVPIALRKADKHQTPSNAASAFPAMGKLTVAENGAATLETAMQAVSIGPVAQPITDMAYDVKAYQDELYPNGVFQEGIAQKNVNILESMTKPENMPGAGKTVPTRISFQIPNNDWDGVYMQFTVDAMGPGYPDAWLQIDYAKAAAPGTTVTKTGTAHVDQFGEYDVNVTVSITDGLISNVAIENGGFSGTHADKNAMKMEQVTGALKGAWNGMAPTQENAEKIHYAIMKPENHDEAIDAVSGATYSARAVRDAVKAAVGVEYQEEVITVPESVEPGVYEVEIGYYSDVVWHSLVENVRGKAQLTVNADKTMSLDFETKSGTSKEPLYILDFNGIYPNNDKTRKLTKEGCKAVMGLSSNDYSDEFFVKGTQVVNHLTFPLEGGLNAIYTTNCYMYVPAMKNLNGEIKDVFFENGKFNVDVFAKIYWDGMKKIGDVPGKEPEVPGKPDAAGTMDVTMKHESKDQPSMCDIMFDQKADISITGDNATIKLLVVNPVPGFPDQGADGTVKNVVVTYEGKQYKAESDITTKPKMTAKASNPAFGLEQGEQYDAQVLTITLPKAAIKEGALLKTDAYVNVAMNTDVVFRMALSNVVIGDQPVEPVNPVSIQSLGEGGVGMKAQVTTTEKAGFFLVQVTSAEKDNSIYTVPVPADGILELSAEKGSKINVWQTAENPELTIPAPNAGGKLIGSASL